ncbi:hypothetical protein PGT21_036099 [Puccinia graminis f. sp. tritici]|uniref:Uncharacterized protein n=1 Tax=Puccinia graminis f. sp. tritici TaxID=56615 RepID=A0A5B0PCK9_PUCGR|nr:hypothetical protein PGT21_036099 [Puccinia graminis f. sp. tritici]
MHPYMSIYLHIDKDVPAVPTSHLFPPSYVNTNPTLEHSQPFSTRILNCLGQPGRFLKIMT